MREALITSGQQRLTTPRWLLPPPHISDHQNERIKPVIFSRRTLLLTFGNAAVSFAVPNRILAAETKPMSVMALEVSIEDNRKIDINTLQEAITLGFDASFVENPSPIQWRLDQLTLLDDILENLPEQMYQPRGNEKLHIGIMADADVPNFLGKDLVALEWNVPGYTQVIFTNNSFSPNNATQAFLYTTHEVVHRELDKYQGQPNPNIDAAFGEPFAAARNKSGGLIDTLLKVKKPLYEKVDALTQQLGDKRKALETLSPEEREKYEFYRSMEYALGTGWYSSDSYGFPDEFTAVLGEIYVQGPDYFVRNLSDLYLGQDRHQIIKRLYDYMTVVFYNRQYLDGLPTFTNTRQEVLD